MLKDFIYTLYIFKPLASPPLTGESVHTRSCTESDLNKLSN